MKTVKSQNFRFLGFYLVCNLISTIFNLIRFVHPAIIYRKDATGRWCIGCSYWVVILCPDFFVH